MSAKLTFKSVYVAFPDEGTVELTGDKSLKRDVFKFLNSAGYDFESDDIELLSNPDCSENDEGFRCIITFEDTTDTIEDFKKEWIKAVAANENGYENDSFIDCTGTLDRVDKTNRFYVKLLTCGRLEVAMIDDNNDVHRYSEPLDEIVNNMSISTVKYFAKMLNARLAAQNNT